MNLNAITDDDIALAAQAAGLDAALGPLMEKAGITSGDVAGMVFSDWEETTWRQLNEASRAAKLREWLSVERQFAPGSVLPRHSLISIDGGPALTWAAFLALNPQLSAEDIDAIEAQLLVHGVCVITDGAGGERQIWVI